jgi:hypothetical protein
MKRQGENGQSGDTTPENTGKTEVSSPVAAWKPFPVEALPEPVRGFVLAGSKALGAATEYLAAAILAALASAIGNTATIRLKRGWTEPAVVWIGLVGESGTLKSPALDLALFQVRRLQAAAIERFNSAMDEYEGDLQRYEADRRAWQQQGRKKSEPPPEKPMEPTCERFYVSDITVEALADRLQRQPRGLLLATEELAAWLGGFDRYSKNGRSGDVAHWLTMFGARDLLVDRKSAGQRPIFVPRAAVSVLGSIQPGTFRRLVGPEHYENGLAARLLLTMPPTCKKTWTEASVDRKTQEAMSDVFKVLYELQPGRDENGRPKPSELELSADGKRAWVSFYNAHAAALADAVGNHAAMLAKIECYAARLALIVHLARSAADDATLTDPLAVDAESVGAGVAIAQWFAQEALRVYAVLQESEEKADRRELVEWIRRKGGRVTARDLQRGPRQFRDPEAAEGVLRELVRSKLGSWEPALPGTDGGRPTQVFRLADAGDGDTTQEFPQETEVSSPAWAIDPDELNGRLQEAAEECEEAATW